MGLGERLSKRVSSNQGRIRVLVNALPCPGSEGVALVQAIAAWASTDDRFELHALVTEDQLAPCLALGAAIRLHGLDHRCNTWATRLFLGILTRQMSADVLLTPPDFGAFMVGCRVFFVAEPSQGFWGRVLGRDVSALAALFQTPQQWSGDSLNHHRPE